MACQAWQRQERGQQDKRLDPPSSHTKISDCHAFSCDTTVSSDPRKVDSWGHEAHVK